MRVFFWSVFVFFICNVECGRKVLRPLDKNANLDFIAKEGGGLAKPVVPAGLPSVSKSAAPPKSPTPTPPVKPAQNLPSVQPSPSSLTPPKSAQQPTVKPILPKAPAQSTQQVKPAGPSVPGASTPGPGSVQQLINYYDSQGKASPIRPYSYSQAVKQGKAQG